MAKTINIKAIGELIDEKPFDMNWFNYSLGAGWGGKLSGMKKNTRKKGAFVHGIDKDTSLQKVIKFANNGDFDEISGFYVAILLFFGKKFIEKVDFSDGHGRNRISRLVDNQKAPSHLKDKIYDLINQDFDFLAFIRACGRNKNLHFDVDSAISVYKLQGDAVIFPLLCQMFYVNDSCDNLNTCLINDLPIDLPIDVSDYVSGCVFPVVVSPAVRQFRWENTQDGAFLYGKYQEKWLCMDVAGLGRTVLAHNPLSNRINYIGGGGQSLPYLICWNWGQIIDAVRHFKSDLLIRDCRNTIFDHYWFIFGSKSLINIELYNNVVNDRTDYEFTLDLQADIPTGTKQYITVQLDGKFIKYCEKSDICYSKSEVFDWFELYNLCKTVI